MYGISNSQQQGGGGGGGAASYKAIKSTLTPSDWQEVARQAFFVGEDAMQWPIDDAFELHAKRSNDIIGLTSGVDYTISVTVDGQVYTKTAQIGDPSQTGGMKTLIFDLAGDQTLGIMIYDDVSAMMPGVSSLAVIDAPETVTSLVITSFTGVGFGSSGKATISDNAIKVNSAVTLYVNTTEKIAVGEKTNGSITLTADSVPTAAISYSLEIVGTDTEGLFELVNGYTPPTIEVPTALPQKTITNTSTNVYIAGDASPYKFSVRDTAVTASKFVRLYPNDADTETWLNTHTVSSIITEQNGLFTFNVDTDRLPSAFSITYMIESLQ